MPEHPDLNFFRQRVAESQGDGTTNLSVVAPTGSEIQREHAEGRMTPAERQRVENQAAAEIRRAMGDA